jgi:hypothetical protein
VRREQLRRWAKLPLARIILAIEELEEIAKHVLGSQATAATTSAEGQHSLQGYHMGITTTKESPAFNKLFEALTD